MRAVSVIFMVLAVALIALGRQQVRLSRRAAAGRAGQNAIGWMLTLAGSLCMVVGVILW
ncbi:MAG TPA: hypothetical protein VH253_19790 [Phycisphaerae bacterium]|nr:hypothetical protein [Phycisphaerae bacterium]